jgi:hypothetical protein
MESSLPLARRSVLEVVVLKARDDATYSPTSIASEERYGIRARWQYYAR